MQRPQLWVSALSLLQLVILPTLGQLPPNNCFPEFGYQGYQGQYIGLVSVRLDPRLVNHELRLEFSQQGFHDFQSYVGNIVLADGEDRTSDNVRQNVPVAYRVDFPLPASPPKITSIRINGKEICSASLYPPPRTGVTLVHTLTLPSMGGLSPNWGGSFPTPTRNPIRNPNRQPSNPVISSVGDWEESFPARNTTWNTPNRVPERREPVYSEDPPIQNFLERNDTFLVPERGLQTRPSQPEVRESAPPLWARPQSRQPPERRTTASPPLINSRETLVPQQAPSGSRSIQCGRERATTTPLVFQGTRLQRGQIPWLVGMFERRESNGPIFFCGGSLIGASTVLTAAHCFRIPGFRDLPASRTAVSLGRNSLDLLTDGEFRGVSQLLIHEKYQFTQLTEADLALARLETPVPFDDFIVPICLWSSASRLDLPQGENAYVAGWGPDESGTGNSDVAKLADMKIVSEATCHRELPPGPLSQPSTLCARKAGTGPCGTDGGGPLMLREGDSWLLRGVIAGGAHNEKENTCDLNRPSVFTDVAKHIDWVRRNMWN